ncbi:MAG: DUF559 domain-containing protein [Deltaproteobacteria bacterium]|nr:DUF559 domain-containing protein [Deltaproteobacteria bacterium]
MRYLLNDPEFKPLRRQLRHNQTEAEYRLWYQLRNRRLNGFKFFRQFGFGSYILDFYCPECRLAIELDGSQHVEQETHDECRTTFLKKRGIEVIRFWNFQVFQEMNVVLEVLWEKLRRRKEVVK